MHYLGSHCIVEIQLHDKYTVLKEIKNKTFKHMPHNNIHKYGIGTRNVHLIEHPILEQNISKPIKIKILCSELFSAGSGT